MKRFISSLLLGGITWAAFFVGAVPVSAEAWVAAHFAGSVVRDVTASADGSVVYAFTTTSLDRSTDGGATWTHLTPPVVPNMLAISSQSSSTVLAATSAGIYRSTNGGDTWSLATGPLVTFANFRSIAIAKTDPQIAWAQTQSVGGANSILKSTNGGASWSQVTNVSLFHGALVAIDPKDAQTVYLTAFQRLHKTVDGGVSWLPPTLLGGTTDAIAGIAIDPDNPSIIYLSGHPRTVRSTDGGVSFVEFGQGYYANPALPKKSGPISISTEGLYLAGANDGSWIAPGIWKRGSEWAKIPGLEIHVNGLFASTSAVFAATDGGLYKLPLTPPAPPAPPGPDPYPVVVIPGIMGSWVDHGVWKLDPISHTYDGLIASLAAVGYREGVDLFPFPYQWRSSNVDTAELLRARIDQIQAQTGQPKVNIVAHSMGGLVARQYIQGIHYGSDVHKLILLGTPNLGAPNAYLAWEGEDFSYMPMISRLIITAAFKVEAAQSGFLGLYDYIHQRVPSLGELLPVYDYLKDADTGALRHYPTRYPVNPFLQSLELNRGLVTARGVQVFSIVGDLGPASTTSALRLTPGGVPLWPDGYPEGHANPLSDRGMEGGPGDRTVPLSSAALFGATYTLPTKHGDLPSAGENEILSILGRPALAEEISGRSFPRFWILFVHSPVEVSVTLAGAPVAPDFYTGPGEEPQVLVIPDPADGSYEVVARGVGSGEYRIDLLTGDAVLERSAAGPSLQGTTQPDEVDRFAVALKDGLIVAPAESDSEPTDAPAAEVASGPADSSRSSRAAYVQSALEPFLPAQAAPPSKKHLRAPARLAAPGAILAMLILGALVYALGRIFRHRTP